MVVYFFALVALQRFCLSPAGALPRLVVRVGLPFRTGHFAPLLPVACWRPASVGGACGIIDRVTSSIPLPNVKIQRCSVSSLT